MLEIGCGTGIATITLADYVRKITAIRVYFRQMMLQAAEGETGRQAEYYVYGRKTYWSFRHKKPAELLHVCDSLQCHAVYEKVRKKFWKKIYDILKPGGVFISATDCLGRNLSKDAVRKFLEIQITSHALCGLLYSAESC